MAHAGGARVWQLQNCTIRGRSPRRCGRGYSWKSASDLGWHGFPESSAVKRRRAPPPRVPASPGASARRTGGGDGGGSDPPFFAAGAARVSVHRRTQWRAINTPLEGRSLHSDPCGKTVEPARKSAPRTEKPGSGRGDGSPPGGDRGGPGAFRGRRTSRRGHPSPGAFIRNWAAKLQKPLANWIARLAAVAAWAALC